MASNTQTEEKSTLLVKERSSSPDVEQAFYNVSSKKSKLSESDFNWKGCCCVIGLFVFVLAVLASLFGAGVVVGRNSVATSSGYSNNTYNWGSNVTISGNTVPVIGWFDGEMTADNIKKNLL